MAFSNRQETQKTKKNHIMNALLSIKDTSEALKLCPWAFKAILCESGVMCFETPICYRTWKDAQSAKLETRTAIGVILEKYPHTLVVHPDKSGCFALQLIFTHEGIKQLRSMPDNCDYATLAQWEERLAKGLESLFFC